MREKIMVFDKHRWYDVKGTNLFWVYWCVEPSTARQPCTRNMPFDVCIGVRKRSHAYEYAFLSWLARHISSGLTRFSEYQYYTFYRSIFALSFSLLLSLFRLYALQLCSSPPIHLVVVCFSYVYSFLVISFVFRISNISFYPFVSVYVCVRARLCV